MNDIFIEAEEELRAQKNWIRVKYITYIFIIMAALLIIGTAIYGWRENNIKAQQEGISDEFLSAFGKDAGLSAENLKILSDVAKQKDSNYSAISSLIIAKKSYDDKDFVKFTEMTEAISDNDSYDPVLRDYARYNLISFYLDRDIVKAQSNLDEIDVSTSPYKHLFILSQGLIYYKEKKYNEAKTQFNLIASDSTAPQKITENIKSILYLIEKTEKE